MRTVMRTSHKALILAAAVTLGAALVSGCGGDDDTAGSERSADVEDVQEDAFWGDVNQWTDEKVTVSANVNEVINQNSFTIAGTPESDVDELLVVSANDSQVQEGQTVQVTGTVRDRFDVVEVEDDLGLDWNDTLYEDWNDEHYIVASSVDTTVDGQDTQSP